ncbi:YjzD family protein [Heyndrickxia sp. NPDC080065]|uniref:YjzD family protein n=1 Tax=Heyndrickxia sp. NPDC080065 TaxID=3390568 RepID=UPI003CFBCB94
MKFIATLFWTFILIQVLGYVASSMTNTEYSIQTMSIIGVIATFLIAVLSAVIPKPSTEAH